jgi:F0F1-type ATP synthase membrane subunit a
MAERRRRPIPSDVRYKDIRDTYTLEIRINLVLGIILMILFIVYSISKNKLQRVVELMGLRKPSNTLNRD